MNTHTREHTRACAQTHLYSNEDFQFETVAFKFVGTKHKLVTSRVHLRSGNHSWETSSIILACRQVWGKHCLDYSLMLERPAQYEWCPPSIDGPGKDRTTYRGRTSPYAEFSRGLSFSSCFPTPSLSSCPDGPQTECDPRVVRGNKPLLKLVLVHGASSQQWKPNTAFDTFFKWKMWDRHF